MKKLFVLLIIYFLIHPSATEAQTNFEFRGVWVATVENIDWPSKKGLSVDEQKAEFISLLELHKRNGMNAIFMQIRPAGDAFYPSQYEPWSEYLMGKQGLPPTPYYDPLEFMIAETHKRGMEFHAWLNPYRAVFNVNKSSISPSHITKIHPEWFLVYGTTKFFNPGLQQVRNLVTNVVKDLITRYDLDGIHMDDYFYPYRIAGKEFPDQKTYEQSGSKLNKDDWRRSNCDSIIKQLYLTIRATNAHVKFGISPFGVWRNKSQDPNGSNTKAGQTNFDDLYADILLWLKMGWIDYVVPQLYWERGHKLCDYDTLLAWWNEHTYGRHLYIGHGIYRANTNAAWKDKNEIPKQIQALRQYATTQGSVYFSGKTFENNPNGWNDSLRNNYYALPAIIPPMPWIDNVPPAKPLVQTINKTTFNIAYKGDEAIKGLAFYALPNLVDTKMGLATLLYLTTTTATTFDRTKSMTPADNRLFVAAVDKNNNVSEWVELK